MKNKIILPFLILLALSIIPNFFEIWFDCDEHCPSLGFRIAGVVAILAGEGITSFLIYLRVNATRRVKEGNFLLVIYVFLMITSILLLFVFGKVLHDTLDYYRHFITAIMTGLIFIIPVGALLKKISEPPSKEDKSDVKHSGVPFEAGRSKREGEMLIRPWHVFLVGIILALTFSFISAMLLYSLSKSNLWVSSTKPAEQLADGIQRAMVLGDYGLICLILSIIAALYLKFERRYRVAH